MEICSKLQMFLFWLTSVTILHMNHNTQSDWVSWFLCRAINNHKTPQICSCDDVRWAQARGCDGSQLTHLQWVCSQGGAHWWLGFLMLLEPDKPWTGIMLFHAVLETPEQTFWGSKGKHAIAVIAALDIVMGGRCTPAGLLSVQASLRVRGGFPGAAVGFQWAQKLHRPVQMQFTPCTQQAWPPPPILCAAVWWDARRFQLLHVFHSFVGY